jgi:hypothetical protein
MRVRAAVSLIGCQGKRFVLTTRSDGDITFEIDAQDSYRVATSWSGAKRTA